MKAAEDRSVHLVSTTLNRLRSPTRGLISAYDGSFSDARVVSTPLDPHSPVAMSKLCKR